MQRCYGRFDYQPHAKSMTLGRLASHVAEMPAWGSMTLDTEVLDLQPGSKPYIAESRAELLERFDKNVADSKEKIAAASDEDWAKIRRFRYAGKELMALPRTAVIRGAVMNHMIHHRAQLGVCLRLNEVEIPGMYGPSADEAKFWEAAAG